MTMIHTDTLDVIMEHLPTDAVAQGYVALAERIAEDVSLGNEKDEEIRIALGIMGKNLAHRVIEDSGR